MSFISTIVLCPSVYLMARRKCYSKPVCLAEHVKGTRREWFIEDRDGCKRSEAEYAAMLIDVEGERNGWHRC
ncbi:hypothetical protein TUM4438_09830 [Shewanella sairae]|uniref:Secreted protein n=1 Tax=Shewanella sairae TaxID=190310 RepID=A0ABQ4P5C6_9GAMM|nr:hypothetical protein TUM4438_09830 [Shewanella sairae]